MNKKLIIEALEGAKAKGVCFGRGAYHSSETDAFCTIGALALHMGIPEKDIMKEHVVHPTGQSRLPMIARLYGISLRDFVELNDAKWRSWDDAIEYVRNFVDDSN